MVKVVKKVRYDSDLFYVCGFWENAMLEILYQDEHCVAVNKPAGMLVHRSWLDRHETEFVMQTLRDQLAQYVYPIHRLDRPTSGCYCLLYRANQRGNCVSNLKTGKCKNLT